MLLDGAEDLEVRRTESGVPCDRLAEQDGLSRHLAKNVDDLLRRRHVPIGSLTVALHPSVAWSIELRGGVSGLRADRRDLRVCELAIGGGARDVVVDLPWPNGELVLSIAGGLSKGVVRRPAATPVSVEIDGGATNLRLDDIEFGAIGGVVRQRTSPDTNANGVVALRVLGGASGLTVSASERTGREQR